MSDIRLTRKVEKKLKKRYNANLSKHSIEYRKRLQTTAAVKPRA
jgi:hypothetical protein